MSRATRSLFRVLFLPLGRPAGLVFLAATLVARVGPPAISLGLSHLAAAFDSLGFLPVARCALPPRNRANSLGARNGNGDRPGCRHTAPLAPTRRAPFGACLPTLTDRGRAGFVPAAFAPRVGPATGQAGPTWSHHGWTVRLSACDLATVPSDRNQCASSMTPSCHGAGREESGRQFRGPSVEPRRRDVPGRRIRLVAPHRRAPDRRPPAPPFP